MSETILDRQDIFIAVADELYRAYNKHGKEKWGRHEFYAILEEEVDEVWDLIKRDRPLTDVVPEIIQVMAVCVRYLETGDRYRGIISTDTLGVKK